MDFVEPCQPFYVALILQELAHGSNLLLTFVIHVDKFANDPAALELIAASCETSRTARSQTNPKTPCGGRWLGCIKISVAPDGT